MGCKIFCEIFRSQQPNIYFNKVGHVLLSSGLQLVDNERTETETAAWPGLPLISTSDNFTISLVSIPRFLPADRTEIQNSI